MNKQSDSSRPTRHNTNTAKPTISSSKPATVAPAHKSRLTPRLVAAAVVSRVLDEGAFIAPALSSALDRAGFDGRDRALTTELAYGTLRWTTPLLQSLKRGMDKPNKEIDAKIKAHLLIGAYQLQHLGDRIPPHAAINEAVDAVKSVRAGLAGFANALLRRLGSAPHQTLSPKASFDEIAAAYGVPVRLARAVAARWPTFEQQQPVIASLCGRPPLSLYRLHDQYTPPPEAQAHPFLPDAFLLDGAGAVNQLDGFQEGAWIVADGGSILCALLVDAQKGDTVVDLCAAPGSKTMLLARTGAHVVAVDQHEGRATQISKNAARMRLTEQVRIHVSDALHINIPQHLDKPADAVLLDAPCSGLGTVRRKPEIKLRRTDNDIQENAQLQSQLLDHAATLVKVGGVLVYSVCSPIPEEGALQIKAFLQKNPHFVAEPVQKTLPFLPADATDSDGFLYLTPHPHQCDAFFAARLRRIS